MSMSDKEPDSAGLEAFFNAARGKAAAASPDLMARILADAEAVQVAARRPVAPRRAGLGEQLYRLLGGWPAMAGLASAAVAGLWLGASLPAGPLAAGELDYVLDMAPGLTLDLAEEDF